MNPAVAGQGQNPLPQAVQVAPNQIAGAPQQQAAVIREPNGQLVPAFPAVNGQLNPLPQARQIQDDWQRSVAQLSAEIRDLRTMMENLLKEMRVLIQDYNMHTELQPALGAVTTAINDIGNVVRSTDHVSQTLRAIDTGNWDPVAALRFSNAMTPLLNKAAQLRQAGAQLVAHTPNLQAPRQPVVSPNQNQGNVPVVSPPIQNQGNAQGNDDSSNEDSTESTEDSSSLVEDDAASTDESSSLVMDSDSEDDSSSRV